MQIFHAEAGALSMLLDRLGVDGMVAGKHDHAGSSLKAVTDAEQAIFAQLRKLRAEHFQAP